MEKWKPIKGYEQYLISSEGRVYSTKSNKIIKPANNNQGYLRVVLNPGKKFYFVHRLVAEAFIDSTGKSREMVNHKDFNPHNNSVENLEWVSRAENMKYSADRGRFKKTSSWRTKIHNSLVNSMGKPIICICPDGTTKEYPYILAVKKDGFRPGDVCRCCKGNRKTHKGCKWKYEEHHAR
ncbi:MAG: NUMOD4 motif-containing HNH endonuclease [Lachnospiraceae bacterium]|nr:NUMOD4 motif-containing HNH endonuclease [Lachnospiraceae bacterium]